MPLVSSTGMTVFALSAISTSVMAVGAWSGSVR